MMLMMLMMGYDVIQPNHTKCDRYVAPNTVCNEYPVTECVTFFIICTVFALKSDITFWYCDVMCNSTII